MINTELNWKKRKTVNEDLPESCWSAKVPAIGWEYVVATCSDPDESTAYYEPMLFINNAFSAPVKITESKCSSERTAKSICKKHLDNTFKKFEKCIKPKWPSN